MIGRIKKRPAAASGPPRACHSIARRGRRTLLGTTALAGLVLLGPLTASSALADGGAGSSTIPGHGGVGGLDSVAGAGGNGATAPASWVGGGGGGGAGALGGGSGGGGDGDPGGGGTGGTGGATAGAAGAAGGNGATGHSAGGGGGGGGAHGSIGVTVPVAASTGGNGGNGGNGTSSFPGIFNLGGGGGGGAGGYGAVITGGAGGTLASAVTGGNGGTGGIGDVQGSGGSGGIGLYYAGGGGTSFTVTSVVAGGNGGAGSIVGAGGVGIYGAAGGTIISAGTISGGLSGDGLTRANAISFAGGTNILELQAGSHVIGNVVAFSAADTLRLGGGANAGFDVAQIGAAAQYRNFGVFEKTGASIWTLTGSTGAALPWAVNAGTLAVNATMASATVNVNSGGTLGGTGSVGAVAVASGGTLAPGNSIGTLTVAGNLIFGAGSSYAVEVSPSAADRTDVTGTATLGGAAVNAVFTGGGYVERQYTIVNATGGIVGTFNSLGVSNLPSGFKPSLGYDLHNAYLNLVLDLTPAPPTPTPPTPPPPTPAPINTGLNGNQTRTANALSDYFARAGQIPIVFGALTPNGLSIASGEAATAPQQTTFNAMDLFMGLLTDPFSADRALIMPGGAAQFADDRAGLGAVRDAYAMITKVPPSHAPFQQRWNVWAAGFGGSLTTDGSLAPGTNAATSRVYGTAVGVDFWLSQQTVAGFALAGGGTNFTLVNALGSGRSDLFQAGGFVRHSAGNAYLTAAAAYGWQDVSTDRIVGMAGFNQFRARFKANSFSGRVEGGYRVVAAALGGIGFTPYAAAQVTELKLPGYAEQVLSGDNTFALSYRAKSALASRSELGLRSDRSFALTDAVLTLRGRAAWAHDFNTERSLTATFQSLPGAPFVVNGAAPPRDAALVTAAAEINWSKGWSAAATFEGEFSGIATSYAGKGVVRHSW